MAIPWPPSPASPPPEVDHGLVDNTVAPTTGSIRDWWMEFLTARDGLDPVSNLVLPGVAGSRPFRSFSHAGGNAATSIEDTLLRSLPADGVGSGSRRLFELGTRPEHDTALPEGDPVDLNDTSRVPSAVENAFKRQRILSKIIGNATTRSNVFVVYMSVGFFQATLNQATGAVQIGARFDLNNDGTADDGHRGFFIIDRSDAQKAYDAGTKQYNWRELVKYRLTIN